MADTQHMNADFRTRLLAMIAASHGAITIGSGFRSVEEQTALWNEAVKKYGSEAAARKWVAPPGKSHHNLGIAADLQGDLNLAHQLAPQYGLYFPMPWEKWHVEPIGSGANKDTMTTTPDWYTAAVAKDHAKNVNPVTGQVPPRPSLESQLGAIDSLIHHTADAFAPSPGALDTFGQAMDIALGQAPTDPTAAAQESNANTATAPTATQEPVGVAPTPAPGPVAPYHRDAPVRAI